MNEDVVMNLIDEVEEYLDAGRVGLYEFIWILRSDSDLPESEFRTHAAEALRRMLSDRSVRLVWERWGDPDYEGDASREVISHDSWNDPTNEPYLAVVRNDEGASASDAHPS